MRIAAIFLLLILGFGACDKEKKQLPISQEKMIDILVDVHVAEAAMQELSSILRDSIGEIYYEQIFEMHGVTKDEFNKALYLIKQDPEQMERVYKDVLAEIDKKMEMPK